jgi:hypothetical protein
MVEGGCFCKRIRYIIADGVYPSVICHCTMCRHIHAAPHVTWLVVPVAQFEYVAGTPTALASSTDGTRYFCSSCGTHVACSNTGHTDIIDVAIGSLDKPEAFPPTLSIYVDTQLPTHPTLEIKP